MLERGESAYNAALAIKKVFGERGGYDTFRSRFKGYKELLRSGGLWFLELVSGNCCFHVIDCEGGKSLYCVTVELVC